jgi:hypothetical protein
MARPSGLESQAVFAFGVAALFAFRQLSTETARFY